MHAHKYNFKGDVTHGVWLEFFSYFYSNLIPSTPPLLCVQRVLPKCIHFACSFVFVPKLLPYYPFKCHLIHRFVKVRSHGPAVTLTLTNYIDEKSYSIDLVPAIKDKTWPEDADEWKARSRRGTRKTFCCFNWGRGENG